MSASLRRHSCRLSLILSFALAAQTGPSAEDLKRAVMSPAAERVLSWFPADTETIVAASSFSMPAFGNRASGEIDFAVFARQLACGDLADLAESKYVKPLVGKKVAVAIRGGRDFETVSSFGSHRSEGCAVVVFEDDLGDAGKEWIEMLREDAKEARKLVGREVFVFPSAVRMESTVDLKRWQGTYLVLLRPDTVLCATSDAYLEEVLKRVDALPADRALPDTLPEWGTIDLAATAWMIRHIPRGNEKRIIDGVTWTMKRDQVEIVYLPVANAADKVEKEARDRWASPGARLKSEFRRAKDGSVIVSWSTNVTYPTALLPALFLHALQNESGAVGAQ